MHLLVRCRAIGRPQQFALLQKIATTQSPNNNYHHVRSPLFPAAAFMSSKMLKKEKWSKLPSNKKWSKMPNNKKWSKAPDKKKWSKAPDKKKWSTTSDQQQKSVMPNQRKPKKQYNEEEAEKIRKWVKIKRRLKEKQAAERKRISLLWKIQFKKELDPAEQMKRIVSATNFYFSKEYLKSTDGKFIREKLRRHHGWMPIGALLKLPRLQGWTDAELLVSALQSSTLEVKPYRLAYSQALVTKPGKFNSLMLLQKNSEDGDDSREMGEEAMSRRMEDDDNKITSDGKNEATLLKENHAKTLDASTHASEDAEEDVKDESLHAVNEKKSTVEEIKKTPTKTTSDQNRNWKYLEFENDDPIVPDAALVRHEKVTLEYLESLETSLREAVVKEFDIFSASPESFRFVAEPDGDAQATTTKTATLSEKLFMEADEDSGEKEAPVITKTKRQKREYLPKYRTKRPVVIIETPSTLESFCIQLLESVNAYAERSKEPSLARCIGFDTEYCSSEEDIHGVFPAMIQISSPDPEGPVGLIWIDKFPNRGRDILKDPNCKHLQEIFADSSMWKVGVKASANAKNLAEWFGANDTVHLFSGFQDIDREESVPDLELAGLSESVLGQSLPKLKQKGAAKNPDHIPVRKGQKVPSAHWRINELTPQMKRYAAHYAACSVDIWVKIKDISS